MATPRYRDISVERRTRAAACVQRHLRDLEVILVGNGLACRVVEGSAVAADVMLVETNTLHTAVRVAIFVNAPDRPTVEQILVGEAFEPSDPVGDLALVRLASRYGRRAVYVLFDGTGAGDDGFATRPANDHHPADPAVARRRAARLRTAWLDLAAAFRRVRHRSEENHDVTESFDVHLIEAPARSVPASAQSA